MSKTLRILFEPERDGHTHMQRDATLLRTFRPGDAPILRLYTWCPPAISLGHRQRAAEILDLGACRDAGIDVVRRPTGGRAILHWDEITYAFVGDRHDPELGESVPATHARIAACLAAGLRALGVEVQFSRPHAERGAAMSRAPCFASHGRHELLVGGRKLLGSAQRRAAHAFLQHGSLLWGPAHLRIAEYLRETRSDPARRRQLRERLARDTVGLRELLPSAPTFERVAAALVEGFAEVLQRRPLAPASPPPRSLSTSPPPVPRATPHG